MRVTTVRTFLVEFLQGGATADDVVSPAAVEALEFGVLQTVGD